MSHLDTNASAVARRIQFGQCEHSRTEGDAFLEPLHNCTQCVIAELAKYGAAMIAVGRRLEREEREQVASEATPGALAGIGLPASGVVESTVVYCICGHEAETDAPICRNPECAVAWFRMQADLIAEVA